MPLSARYLHYCPNCRGPILEERLRAGLACSRCQPTPESPLKQPGLLVEHHRRRQQLNDWCAFFESRVGLSPWPLQKTWAARVISGRSFAMVAPTGIGKTTFGLLTAAWLAEQGKRSFLIFPTRLLVQQAAERLAQWGVACSAYLGQKEEREAIFQRARPISLFTVAFLYRNADRLPRPVDLLFVDDVDSLLKSARNVDRVLSLLGFGQEEIEEGFHLLALRRRDPVEAERRAERLRRRARGVLAVSSATAAPRSRRVHLFRELLGFEVAAPSFSLRKVADLYETCLSLAKEALYERALTWIGRLGGGGLLFLPGDERKEVAEAFKAFLEERGVLALTYEEEGAIERFQKGEVDFLIGFASWRNPLARGIDLPERIRYALFVGVPKLRFTYETLSEPETFLRIAVALLPLLRGSELALKIRRLSRLRRPPQKELTELAASIEQLLLDPDFRARVEASPEVGLRFEEGKTVLVFADLTGYLQASGRTSRLTPAGLTQGLALILAEDEKAWTALLRRLRYLLEEPPRPVEEVDLEALLARIDQDRERVKRGEVSGLAIPAQTVVVESPNKARTLASFFGRPLRRYLPGLVVYEVLTEERYLTVTATRGHVTDLALKGGLYGVELAEHHYLPRYHPLRRCPEGAVPDEACPDGRPSLPDRDLALHSLREHALETERLFVATDPDTEGEKIGWDVDLALRAFAPSQRSEFHAVTRREFLRALSEARALDEKLVAAQKVRRIADRWIGFALSEKLQRAFGRKSLSAGRVQTPVLGWVIEREKEARTRLPFTEVTLACGERTLTLHFPGALEGELLEVARLSSEIEERSPPPPFTTDTLLAEASRHRIPVPEAMALAQELFEAGLITYHRTDATYITPEGRALARQLIAERFGEELFAPRSWGKPGTHEAIRPTRPMGPEALEEAILLGQFQLNEDHLKLYRLIFDRFLASQMVAAKLKVVHYGFRFGGEELLERLVVGIEAPGWTLALPLSLDPEPAPGRYRVAAKPISRPKAERYTEGSLVAEMKRRGIGRPSTYAPTIERLLARRYLVRRGRYLFPTRLGQEVYRFLTADEGGRRYVSEAWTRELEALMDAIEEGADPTPILDRLYRATRALRAEAAPVDDRGDKT